ncbi:HAMP domain-containing sensor histidine kinase [uncultured Eubacterium sp.]|uniref:sensor histidine kinase n=1 Tax=uncultured Eubacterium sp. TaxID=165185 RepID=UPI0025D04982|nr:HAMP domain-containing sensor histidine kinase [uncultured Eubacterium sp.]
MIKKLRKKFIIAAMCAILIVLESIILAVNIVNYHHLVEKADTLTEWIVSEGGSFGDAIAGDSSGIDPGAQNGQNQNEQPPEVPDDLNSDTTPPDKSDGKNATEEQKNPPDNIGKDHMGFSKETPFETRYFTVTFDSDGNMSDCDTGKIAAIDEDSAKEYAGEVYTSSKITGFFDIYRYRVTETEDGTMIVFVDCRQEITTVKNFAVNSFGISTLGLAAVFVLVVFFSKLVFRPVAESYKKQKQFITDASHGLKTPLTIIDANTEIIEMDNGESQWTKSIRNQVHRLTTMTQQLITLSKLDEGEVNGEKTKFSLSDALVDCVQPFETPAMMQNKTIETDIADEIRLNGEEKTIRQLFDILLDNAVKYSTPDSTIRVHLYTKGNKVILTVWNETEPIPQGNLDQIFERFYRLDEARNSEKGGSGIGLSVAKAVVAAHKGKISAFSEDGHSMLIKVVW